MRVGFAVLVHERLDRAAVLVRHLAAHGAPVAVHLDPRAGDPGPLAGLSGVTVLRTHRADWGRFGLVEATLDCVEVLLEGPEVDHICLLSGSCLPIRPLDDLAAMLARNPDRNFIDSEPLSGGDWVQGGLSLERFTLYHPFSWRRRRRLFDLSVTVQRALGVRRRLPPGLMPHLGLQWWCLATPTLRALVRDPRLPAWRRFFRRTWIPDEGFFQTVVRALRPDDDPAPPLHLARFDPRGRPHVFHDDHAGVLAGADAWFARKIDPDAGVLYSRFLGEGAGTDPGEHPVPEDLFRAARHRERGEGHGVLSAARFPRFTSPVSVATLAPYLVVLAEDTADACAVLAANPGLAVHSDLFGDDPPRFAGGDALHWGNLAAGAAIREHRPAQFLAMTVRADRALGRRTALAFTPVRSLPDWGPGLPDAHLTVAAQLAGDPNARLVVLGDPQALLVRLRLPYPARNPRSLQRPRPFRAWWTALQMPSAGSGALAALAAADWSDPVGWTLPTDPPGGWPQ